MNKTLKLSFIALLAGLCIMTQSYGEEQPPCKIGIVDIKKVVANSSEAKSIQTEQKKKIDELTRFIEKARLSVDKEKDPEKQKELEEKFTKELNEKRTAIDSEYAKKLSLAESFFMVRFRPLEPTGVGLTTRDRRDGGIAGFALGQKSRLCNSSEAKSSP